MRIQNQSISIESPEQKNFEDKIFSVYHINLQTRLGLTIAIIFSEYITTGKK